MLSVVKVLSGLKGGKSEGKIIRENTLSILCQLKICNLQQYADFRSHTSYFTIVHLTGVLPYTYSSQDYYPLHHVIDICLIPGMVRCLRQLFWSFIELYLCWSIEDQHASTHSGHLHNRRYFLDGFPTRIKHGSGSQIC